jgi:hypothetical protein
MGNIVFLCDPIPNSLKEPSLVYKNPGFIHCIKQKLIKKTNIEINVKFVLIRFLIIIKYIQIILFM